MAKRKSRPEEYRRRRTRSKAEPTEVEGRELQAFMVADRGVLYRPLKEQITLRLDKDVVAWFKARGVGYQTRINEALREYVLSHLSDEGTRG